MTVRWLPLLVLAALAPAVAAAQGLGDVAAREKQKRAKQAREAKSEGPRVLTNEDLAEGRPPGQPSSGPPEAAPSEAPEAAEAPAAAPTEEIRSYLDAITAAQASLASTEARIKELADRLNPMSTSFIYGASSGTGGDLHGEEMRVREEMRQAETQLVEARQSLAAANQALQDFRQGRAPAAAPQF